MCGIVGAVAQRDIAEILLEGLRRLEYRGYDSAGMAIVDASHHLHRLREVGKVKALSDAYSATPVSGGTGIAHTRWATHGEPVKKNAHPHTSGHIAVVHNGIIENYEALRNMLIEKGYQFTSDTDTEVIAHLVHYELTKGGALLQAVQRAIPQLKGAYGTVIIDSRVTDCMVAARSGSPLVIGQGIGENFLASDPLALLPVTRRFIYLEEGDIAEITRNTIAIFDAKGQPVQRKAKDSEEHYEAAGKAGFRHYMQKEIFEQPLAIKNTLMNRLEGTKINLSELGEQAIETFKNVEHIHIVACGTSYYAGMIARYWFEAIAGIPCEVEIASEFRYRHPTKRKNSLFITLSQSGETADTLAALQLAKSLDYLASLTICNVASSSLVRESDFALITKAGVEIGVASTKAMTTQLSLLLLLVGYFAKQKAETASHYDEIIDALHKLPARLEQFLSLDKAIANIANQFIDVQHALFLGRGEQFAVAMEGALKLKEISYIHAEAYAGGELKHGPIALIDGDIPVIISAPYNELLDKLKSNIEEVRARGGKLFIFTDDRCDVSAHENSQIICVPNAEAVITPLLYIVPMQLLAYHVACVKGTDVDQPRNLAKSVTVE